MGERDGKDSWVSSNGLHSYYSVGFRFCAVCTSSFSGKVSSKHARGIGLHRKPSSPPFYGQLQAVDSTN